MTEQILEEIRDELKEIRQLLQIQNVVHISRVKEIIEHDHLTTDNRRKMYDLFDGKHNMKDIAKKVSVSEEAVRLFLEELAKVGAIRIFKKLGRTKYPIRIVI